MKKSRRELEITLGEILDKNNKNKDVLDNFIFKLTSRFYRGRVVRIFDKSIQLTLLSNEELFLVTQALYDITQEKNIEPSRWFLESERNDALKISITEEDTDEIVEFVNFSKKSGQDEWVGYVSYKTIQSLYERGKLTYNQETQRKATVVERGGSKYIMPTIHKSSVTRIAKKMIDGKFHTNAITLNVTKTLSEELFYDERENILRVPVSRTTELAIIDGAHRILAMVKALNIEPNLNNEIVVIIKNLTVEEAQEFIIQEALTNKQDLSHLRKSNTRDTYLEMTKTIARMGDKNTNVLFNRIGFLDGKMDNCLVTGDKFSMGIKDNFKDICEQDNGANLMNVAKYLVEFFNYIAELAPYEYEGEYELLKKRSVSTCSNFYLGMLSCARILHNNNDWKNQLEEIIENISWDIKDKVWKDCGVTVENMSTKSKRKLYDYFNSLGKNGEENE